MNPFNDSFNMWYIVLLAAMLIMVLVGFAGAWLNTKTLSIIHYHNAKFVCVAASTLVGATAGILIVVESFRGIEQFYLSFFGSEGTAMAYAELLTFLTLMVISIFTPLLLYLMSYRV